MTHDEGNNGGDAAVPLAIDIRDLHKVYGQGGGVHAVDGLTLGVPQGSFFGFLGPNGAGKTTTIRILMGTAKPTSGTVRVLGMALSEGSLAIRRELGLVPDDTLLFDYLTGQEYLEFTGRMYELAAATARERAVELMELLELTGHEKKLIGEYSKGMRKRVAMASALIHRPRVFLMDEPFEGVDAVGARLMKSILQDLVARGATIFLTSHVMDVVERLCDQIAIVRQGKVVAQGTIEQLREQAAAGSTTLEDIFVQLVGGERRRDALSWL